MAVAYRLVRRLERIALPAEVAQQRAEVQRGLSAGDLPTLGRLLMRLEENALA